MSGYMNQLKKLQRSIHLEKLIRILSYSGKSQSEINEILDQIAKNKSNGKGPVIWDRSPLSKTELEIMHRYTSYHSSTDIKKFENVTNSKLAKHYKRGFHLMRRYILNLNP